MIKDYYNEIIPPWDSRYGKLGHIWKRFNKDSLVSNEGPRMIYYFIPPELILKEYTNQRGRGYYNSYAKFDDDWSNWVSAFQSNGLVEWCCNLSPQEFYDLVFLNLNNKLNRPRCSECKSILLFSNKFSQGYSNRGSDLNRSNLFCSQTCQSKYYSRLQLGSNKYLKFQEASNYYETRVKAHRTEFLSRTTHFKEAKLYASYLVDGTFKFGITCIGNYRFRDDILTHKFLFTSTPLEVANLEAQIKLEFNGREFLDSTESHRFFQILKSKLRIRPILNPFD